MRRLHAQRRGAGLAGGVCCLQRRPHAASCDGTVGGRRPNGTIAAEDYVGCDGVFVGEDFFDPLMRCRMFPTGPRHICIIFVHRFCGDGDCQAYYCLECLERWARTTEDPSCPHCGRRLRENATIRFN